MYKRSLFLVFALFLLVTGIQTYTNPIQGYRNTPDPGVLYDGHNYFAVTTQGWDSHYFPIWKGSSLFNMSQVSWIFPSRPTWAIQNFWAPELHIVGYTYAAYYTARDSSNFLCIGVAFSESGTGPFIDKGAPLLKNGTEGVIDPTIYKFENGTIYLIYKVDGNAHGNPTQIYAIKLTDDGKSLNGQHHLLLRNSLSFEQGIIEAPWMIHENGYFYLFYSSCGYASTCYSVSVARSQNFFGPYEKKGSPILQTRSPETETSWEGPGHCSVIKTDKGNWAMIYHAWPHGQAGKTKRVMLANKVTFENGWPKVGDGYPSETEQPQF